MAILSVPLGNGTAAEGLPQTRAGRRLRVNRYSKVSSVMAATIASLVFIGWLFRLGSAQADPIGVRSEPGVGSTFSVELPGAAGLPEEEGEVARPSINLQPNPKTLLYVEETRRT